MKDFEKELANAYGEVLDIEIDEVIAESEKDPHVFSKGFENRMEELIRAGKPGSKKALSKRGKRILIIAIAAVLALIATACAVPEIRESIAGFFVKIFSDHVEYTDPAITKERIEEEYGLVPVPDGFELIRENTSDDLLEAFYEDNDGNVIIFRQSANSGIDVSIDNEHGEFYEREIGERKVQIYYSEGSCAAAWVENGYYFSLDYGSSIELSIMEEWIGTVKIK